MDPDTIEVAALGRPLHPGTLYDCRNDTFIPGVSLWDQKAIDNDLKVDPQPNTSFDFTASDSLTDKNKLMDISASLKVSFLAGLVEVSGSGSYINDKSSSMRQCRATIKYKQTTAYKHLGMTQLGKVIYPDVFNHKTATHVVTAVLYGVEAYMIFEQMASNEEEKQKITGNLEVSIKKIPSVEISGKGAVEMTDEEKKKVEKFSCTFHGDLKVDKNPSTYEEAVLLYKKLPELIGDGSQAVPVKVWLYPLKKLDSRAAQLVREVGAELVSQAVEVMGQLDEAEIRANDTISQAQAIKAIDVTDKLDKFQKNLTKYKENIKLNLSKELSAIRAGTERSKKLLNILKSHDVSAFTHDKMRKWLDDKEAEIVVLEGYISSLEGYQIMPPGPDLTKILSDPNKEYVHVFTFTSLKYEEPYLCALDACLANKKFKKEIFIAEPWYTVPEVSQRMRDALSDFKKVSEITENNCISYISDNSHPGASIHKYRAGTLEDKEFKPEATPPNPEATPPNPTNTTGE